MNRLYNFHSRSDLATYRYTFFFNFAVCLANNKLYLIIPLYLPYLRKLGNMDMLIAFIKIWVKFRSTIPGETDWLLVTETSIGKYFMHVQEDGKKVAKYKIWI